MIRIATEEDAEKLLEIYAYYVKQTAITFEYEVPTVEEFRGRIRKILEGYPYLVDEEDGQILGYSYAHEFKDRAAYDWDVETTIYVREGIQKKGVGKQLYDALEKALSLQHILSLNACIGVPEVEDEHLTMNSVQFHEHLGYEMVGKFHWSGYKFGRWYHMVWMEKLVGEHTDNPLPIRRFPEIRAELDLQFGIR